MTSSNPDSGTAVIVMPGSPATPSATALPSADDPFNPDRLRLSQDFEATVGVKKALITVPVTKPNRQWFVRVHPDPAYRIETAVLEMKEDRESYLVSPDLRSELPGEITRKLLVTSINRQGVVFLWSIRLPGLDGKCDEWNRSALEAAKLAQGCWVRVASNMSLGAYEVFEATSELPDPTWPDVSFSTLLSIAFKDRYIKSLDHLVIKRLRGEV